ncbi:T9SS type A sorting domain-containing protein [Carboxylicivirga sp. RSCT41]|uniref:T9SS type A sorting domain-containing protein n=1 Tax=Carboxylicivirga agarovorans TaxID=3417570 RepID=UPI003D353658
MRKLFTLLMISTTMLSYGQNQLNNPGFENATWNNEWQANDATISQETAPANVRSGASACYVQPNANNKGIKSIQFSVDASAYIGSAWIKAAQGAPFRIQMVVRDASNNAEYITNSFNDVATGDWQNISMACAVPEGGSIQMAVQARGADNFYVDDLEILKISSIENGGFEMGIDKYWSDVVLKNGAVANISEESSTVQEGSKAMKVEITGVGTSDSWGDVQSVCSSLIAFDGAPKVISYYAKVDLVNPEDNANGGFGFGYKSAFGKHEAGENNYGGSFNLSSEYRQYKWVLGATDYAKYLYAGPSLRCGPALGAYYFDNITIEAYPGAPTITSTAVTDVKVGEAYSYTAVSSNPGIGKWVLTKPETGAEWLSIDQYTGELMGTPDAAGSIEVTVTLNDGFVEVPQTFTINVSAATAIGELTSEVNIYPNPMESKLQIATDAYVTKVEIYSLTGQRVLGDYTGSKQVNVASLSKGVYIVSVEADGQIIRKKMTKQ